MGRQTWAVSPEVAKKLTSLGNRLKLARLRRHISASLMSERLGISRTTLQRLENGEPSMSMGTYCMALRILGLDESIDDIARNDVVGRALQDEEVSIRQIRR